MLLLKFIEQESNESYQQLALMAVISGIANGLLIAIVNHAVKSVVEGEDLTQYFAAYMIAFVLFLYTQWYAFDRAIILIEKAIYNIRNRLSQKVKHVELAFIEKMGADSLYLRLTQNDTFISQAIPQITAAAQMFILMIFSFLYLAYISPLTFFIMIMTIVMGVFFFQSQTGLIRKSLQNAKGKEARYFRSIADMINGFKEIKINNDKANAILQNISEVSLEAKTMKIEAGRKEARMWGFGRVFVYALLPIFVFIIPTLRQEPAADVFRITSIMLFIIGPITILVNMVPIMNRVNLVIQELANLEAEMDQASTPDEIMDDAADKDFQHIRLKALEFGYPGSTASFSAGPFTETISKGELLFIVGGNGSGKSTFLKMLTGLYYSESGTIHVDDWSITKTDYPAYRSLFSVVFTDFHLFEKLYGIQDLSESHVNVWLKKMHMQHKVKYQDGAFSSISLSTGQRKRLAFIAAMLEEKPILVIDEFAADQDPQFRQYFYETLLPEIKASGKTVIAVTHDDHYFHVADRILKMEEGRLFPYEDTLKPV